MKFYDEFERFMVVSCLIRRNLGSVIGYCFEDGRG